jgi:hypothetical protein
MCFTLPVVFSCSVNNVPSPPPSDDRPGAIEIAPDYEPGGEEALVAEVTPLGDGVRVLLTSADGRALEAHVSAARAEQLELRAGAIVSVRPPSGASS